MTIARPIKRRRLSPPDPVNGESSLKSKNPSRSRENDFYTRAAGWDLEQNYEQRAHKEKKKQKENTRLPIKTAEGAVQPLQIEQNNTEDEDNWLGSEDGSEQSEPSPNMQEEAKVPTRQQINEAKEELARIASLINEDPEEHAGGFRTLATISSSPNPTIKRLALATQLSVYKDAIPGYRIRPLAEADQTDKVSKDVRRLRAFEQALVSSYQTYIKDLANYARASQNKNPRNAASLNSVAISCACALLSTVPHFNFRGELLKIIVLKLTSRKVDADFVRCRDAVENLFRNDDDGGSSLDAVSLITKMMKSRNYQIHESVLNTFLHLRLLTEFSSKASQNRVDKAAVAEDVASKKMKHKKEFRTKKQRKIMKERTEVEKEFKEADAIVSHEQRDRMQSETLKMVFVTYFRILKARTPNLMGAVLEGLAKYAHLINQDFFGDILEALKDLISDAEKFLHPENNDEAVEEEEGPGPRGIERDHTREALLCTTTAFALLDGQDAAKSASTLHLDLTFFTSHLYRNLHALSLNPDLELSAKSLRLADPDIPSISSATNMAKVNLKTTTVLLLRALTSMLTPRTVPPVRLAAFTKQLFIIAPQLPEKSTLAMLGLLSTITKIHGRKIASLWNTEERKGDGVFDALRGDIEGSNPFTSTTWEGELLKWHYSPKVREAAKGIEQVVQGIR